jgi:hypothetical protein
MCKIRMLPAVLAGVWMALSFTSPAETAGRVRLAVLSDSTDEAVKGLADRLAAEYSKLPEVVLVERQDVQRLLDERGLSAQAGAATLLNAGQFLGADVLASLRAGPGFLNCRVVDVRRGWVYASTSYPWPGGTAAAFADLRTRLRYALALALKPASGLRPIAVMTFVNADVDRTYDPLQDDLPALLEESLLRTGTFVPLDRSSLIDLVEERALAGEQGELAGAPQLLTGHFSTRRGPGQTLLKLSLRRPAESGVPLWEGETAVDQLPALVGQAIRAITPKLSEPPAAGTASLAQEAGALRERATLFGQQRDVHRAVELLEAALALCPTQVAWQVELRTRRSELAMAGVQPGESPKRAERRINAFIQCVDEARRTYRLPPGQRPALPQTWVGTPVVGRYAGNPACIEAWMQWADAHLADLGNVLREARARPSQVPLPNGKRSPAEEAAVGYCSSALNCSRNFLSLRPSPRQLLFFYPLLLARVRDSGALADRKIDELNRLFENLSVDGGQTEDKPRYLAFLDAYARSTNFPRAVRLAHLHGAVLADRLRPRSIGNTELDAPYNEATKRVSSYLRALVAGPTAESPVTAGEQNTLNQIVRYSDKFAREYSQCMAAFAGALTAQGSLSPAVESLMALQFRTSNGLARPMDVLWDDVLLVYLSAHKQEREFVDQTLAIQATRASAPKFAAFARQNGFSWPPKATWPPPSAVAVAPPPPRPPAAPPAAAPAAVASGLSSELLTDFEACDLPGHRGSRLQPLALLRRGDQLYVVGSPIGDRSVWAGRYDPDQRSWRWLEPVKSPFGIPDLAAIHRETGVDEVDIAISDEGIYLCRPGSGLLRIGFDGFSSVITPADGVPAGVARSLGFAGRIAYVGCDGGVARWDREKRTWEVLFSSRQAPDANPLNGGGAYVVRDMEVDAARNRLVFVVEGDRPGLWSYDLATRRCAQLMPHTGRRPLRDGDWLFLSDYQWFVAYNLSNPTASRGIGTALAAPIRAALEPKQPGRMLFPAAALGGDVYFCGAGGALDRMAETGDPQRCEVQLGGSCSGLVSWQGGLAAIRGQRVVFHASAKAASAPGAEVAKAAPLAAANGRRALRFERIATSVQVKTPFLDDDQLGAGLEETSVKRFWFDVIEILSCRPGLDVYWCQDRLFFMRQKDLLEARKPPVVGGISDVIWDGAQVWLATRGGGLIVLDADGRTRGVIGPAAGLPPGDQGIRLRAVEPGRVLAVGAAGNPLRTWCAEVTAPVNGRPSVNVFHRATRAPQGQTDQAGLAADLAFTPAWMLAVDAGAGRRPEKMLVGRLIESTSGPTHPLLIEVPTRRVSVLDHGFRTARTRTMPTYVSVRGGIVEADDMAAVQMLALDESGVRERPITVSNATDARSGKLRLEQRVAGLGVSAGEAVRLLGVDGAGFIYVPGTTWHRIDPQDWNAERLELENFPAGPRADWHVWMTQHYGLVGLANGALYRLTLAGASADTSTTQPR